MKIKTSELTGAALNWAVMYALHNKVLEPSVNYWLEKYVDPQRRYLCESHSTDWAQGGPIIEQEKISIEERMKMGTWLAYIKCADTGESFFITHGPTPLIAAMRCYVASKLGDEVEIPEELI